MLASTLKIRIITLVRYMYMVVFILVLKITCVNVKMELPACWHLPELSVDLSTSEVWGQWFDIKTTLFMLSNWLGCPVVVRMERCSVLTAKSSIKQAEMLHLML